MARVTVAQVQGWLDPAKLTIVTLDTQLINQLETEIISRLAVAFDTSTWTNDTTTPELIKVIISKTYASWLINRFYSENQDEGNDYANGLLENAEMLISGLLNGTITIPGGPTPSTPRIASFYPNDASSAQEPTYDDMSLGGPYFSLGRSF